MAVKLVVTKKEEIPSGMETEYKEKDGKFFLDLDGDVVPKGDLNEFRNNNIELLKEKEKLMKDLAKYEGLDINEIKDALKLKQQKEDQKLIDAGKVDELVEQKVERMRQDFEGKNTALQASLDDLIGERDKLDSQLSNVLIDSQIQAAVNEVGKPRSGAMQDILNRGRSLFKLQDGTPVPVGADGNPIYAKDGKTVMTFKEWAVGLQENAGYLFESASGGGSFGNSNNNNNSGGSTIRRNDTEAFGRNLEDIAKGKVVVTN